jgi:hypothetical protein
MHRGQLNRISGFRLITFSSNHSLTIPSTNKNKKKKLKKTPPTKQF